MTNNTMTGSDFFDSSISECSSYKGFRNIKNLSFIPTVTMDVSSSGLTPLNTPRAHLLAGLRTAPCSNKQMEHDLGSQKSGNSFVSLQNIYKKDYTDVKQYGISTYPHAAALSPKTARGLGFSVYKQTDFPMNSVSEPSTPYRCHFDESKGMAQQNHSPSLFANSSFTLPTPSQQYSYPQKQSKYSVSTTHTMFPKNVALYCVPEQNVFPYSPMTHESSCGPSFNYSTFTESQNLSIPGPASQNSQNYDLKKNRYYQNFMNINGSITNSNSSTRSHGHSSPTNKEGVPYRQPRGPPPMEELLSTNESENKNFSVRLRKQAINKILHAGAQRKNNISSSESTTEEDDYLLKVS